MSEMDIDRADSFVDPRLWRVCAGWTILMPRINSLVYYFPQGHIEQLYGGVDLDSFPSIPHKILCRVKEIDYLADRVSDEAYAKMRLVPVSNYEPEDGDQDDGAAEDRPEVIIKTLTMSDANNGGGFSVPTQCARKIFPPLNYKEDPPCQWLVPKDIHGEGWEIKHIHRGSPVRHLLTSGWSKFVTAKNLIGDDSVLFLKAENGGIRVLIRRAIDKCIDNWNPKSFYARCCAERGENGGKLVRSMSRFPEKETADSVTQAAVYAANSRPFEVLYYPRKDAPEFVVKAERVRSGGLSRWRPGMRVKMLHENEDSLETTWVTGTVSAVKVSNATKWPDSPWKALQVKWDHDPCILQYPKHVSPWLVKPDSSVLPQKIAPPTKKKTIKELQGARLEVNRRLQTLPIPHNANRPSKPSRNLPETRPALVDMLGARNSRLSLTNLNPERGRSALSLSVGSPAATAPTRSSYPTSTDLAPRSNASASPAHTLQTSNATPTVRASGSNGSASSALTIGSSNPTSSSVKDPSRSDSVGGSVSKPPSSTSGDTLQSPNESQKGMRPLILFSVTIWVPNKDSDNGVENNSDGSEQIRSSPEVSELGRQQEVSSESPEMGKDLHLYIGSPPEMMDQDMEPRAP